MKTLKIFAIVLVIFMSGCGPKDYNFDKMSDEDVTALYERASKFHNGDIGEEATDVAWVLDSVDSEDEARSIFAEEFENDYMSIVKCDKVFENEKYLIFDVAWEQEYSQKCLLFKRSFYDSVAKTVGDSKGIKEVFDLKNYSYVSNEAGAKMLRSTVKKDGDNYVYKVYIFNMWQERLYLDEIQVTVDAQGKVIDEAHGTIREI